MRKALVEYAEGMLRYMLANADEARSLVVSRKNLVRDLQISPTMVACVMSYLKELNLIEVHPRYAENGGQLENGYTVTEAGCDFVAESLKARR